MSISEAYVGSLVVFSPYIEQRSFKILLKDRLSEVKNLCIQRAEECLNAEEIKNLHGLYASLPVSLNFLSTRLCEKSVSAPLIKPNPFDHSRVSEPRNSVAECFRDMQLILGNRFKEVNKESYETLTLEWKSRLGDIIRGGSQEKLRSFIFATCLSHISFLDTSDGVSTLFICPNIFDELNVGQHIFPDHIEAGHNASYFEMKNVSAETNSSKAIEAVRYIRRLVLDPDVEIRLQPSRNTDDYPDSFEVLLKVDDSILHRTECPIESLQEKVKRRKFRSTDTALFTLDPLLGRYSINYTVYPCSRKLFDECIELPREREESRSMSLLEALLDKVAVTELEARSEIERFSCLSSIDMSDIEWIINNTRGFFMFTRDLPLPFPSSSESFFRTSDEFAVQILDKDRSLSVDFKNRNMISRTLGREGKSLSIKYFKL